MKNTMPLKVKLTQIFSTVFILIFILFAGYICFDEGWSKCQTIALSLNEDGKIVYSRVFDKITSQSIPYFICNLFILATLFFLILRTIRPSRTKAILCASFTLVATVFYLSLNTDLSSMVFFMGILDNHPIKTPLALSAKYIVTMPVLLTETLHLIFFLCHIPQAKKAETTETRSNDIQKNDL